MDCWDVGRERDLQNLVRTARLTVYHLVGDVVRDEIARRQLEGQFPPESMKAVLSANDR